jgi:N-methylhydantoinase B/oxoprolinase/acetone carboxylase alpha subunit
MLCNFERVGNLRAGDGGGKGAPGRVTLSRAADRTQGPAERARRRFIRLELPGGGGFGDPADRDPEQVALDVADGLVSRQTAVQDYRVSVTSDGALDRQATAQLRAAEGAHQSVGAP